MDLQATAQALQPIADLMVNDLKTSFNFFGSKTNQATISRVILSGGTAQLPGLVDYLRTALGVEIGLADNFTGFSGQLPEKNQLTYGIALGLLKRQT